MRQVISITTILFLFFPFVVWSQGDKPLYISQLSNDAKNLATAGALRSKSISFNPSVLFTSSHKLVTTLSVQRFNHIPSTQGRLAYYSLGMGLSLNSYHSIYGGFNYLGGLKYPILNIMGDKHSNNFTPFEWTIDLGYAFKLSKNLSLFTTSYFYQSYTGRVARGVSFSIGADYHQKIKDFSFLNELSFLVKLSDLGPKVKYSRFGQYKLPTSVVFQGGVQGSFASDFRYTFSISDLIYTLSRPWEHNISLGSELGYGFFTLRSGYLHANTPLESRISLGFGLHFPYFEVDLGYRHGINDSDLGYRPSSFMGTISFGIR